MKIPTKIQLKFHNQAFADEAYAFVRTMIKAIFANGAKVLPFEDSFSLSVCYRHQYMNYRHKAKKYTESIEEAERLLADLKQNGACITLSDCEILQGALDMRGGIVDFENDCHREFFVQLCFLISMINKLRGYRSLFEIAMVSSRQFIRTIGQPDFSLRIDCYAGEKCDRYVWEYREGFGGYAQKPAVSSLYANIVRIYVRDVPAFRDDTAITEKYNEMQESMKGHGKIIMRLPSALPYVGVIVEADTAELCQNTLKEFSDFAAGRGH